jgi:hypothetical protein
MPLAMTCMDALNSARKVSPWKARSFGYAQDDVHGCAKFVGGREPLAMTCMDALNSREAGRMKVQNKRPVIERSRRIYYTHVDQQDPWKASPVLHALL